MVATINQSFISQFSDNLHMLLEQQGSKLRKIYPVEMAKGEKHFFDRLGNFTANEVSGRLDVTNLQDPAHSRRMASLKRYEASTYLDDVDKFKLLIDPTSDYAKKLANAHGKNYDSVLIDALLGTAATGADGSGSQAFDTSNQQIAHGSAGFTVDKFNQALRILQANEVDVESDQLVLLIGALGIEDLMGDSNNRFTSFDYMSSKPLADGRLPQFRGVEIVHTERIPDETAATTYRGILSTKDALKVAMAKDMEVKVAPRPDLNFAQQVSTYMMFGAVRMEEGRVVDVLYQ
jgi:hypothetical protein